MGAQGTDVGSRVEALLAQLRRQGGDPAVETGEELVRELVAYYGEGLAVIVGAVSEAAPEILAALMADPLVESQLVLHGLHPLSLDERIEQALDQVRPYLGSHAGGVAYLGVDDAGVAHLRLDGSCNGCPSSTVTVKLTIEEALLGAVPELTGIEVEGTARREQLLQIGLRPGAAPAAAGAAGHVWLHPSRADLPVAGRVRRADLDGRPVLLARLGESYLAYADSCPACARSLLGDSPPREGVALEGEVLGCVPCGARYDVRLAGRAADRTGRRLEPLPLLDDVSGIRVAVPPGALVPS